MATATVTVTDVGRLSGFFKDVFAPNLINLIPNNRKLQKEIVGFREVPIAPGKQYHQPVTVQNPQGFTFAGASAGAFSINSAVAGLTQDALVTANQIILEDAFDYESAALASSSKTAFGQVVSHIVQRMLDSGSFILEYVMVHGQVGLGTVSSVSTNVLTITTATHAAGVWASLQGALIDVYNGSTLRGSCAITAVDTIARTVTVDAAPTSTGANDTLWVKGQKGNDLAGIEAILTNTGTLFNISASTYPTLWKGRNLSAGSAAATLAKVETLIGYMVVLGLVGEAVALVNTQTWNNLMTNEATLRRYTEDAGGKFVNGAKGVEFYGQNGLIRLVPHTMVKEATSYFLSAKDWIRIGATDWTFEMPGKKGQFFLDMQQNAGYKLRLYTNQAVFCEAPGRSGYMNAIVNTY